MRFKSFLGLALVAGVSLTAGLTPHRALALGNSALDREVKHLMSELRFSCMGDSGKVIDPINPISWFAKSSTYFLVRGDQANLHSGKWIVRVSSFSRDGSASWFYVIADVLNEKVGYIGDEDQMSKMSRSELKRRVLDPAWLPKVQWTKNLMKWIRNGKPQMANYC